MKLVGGDVKDIIAFGDDHGDLGMLQEAGVGVLMKNGRPELMEQVSYVSKYTNDEDGVARLLAEYFQIED